MRTMRFKKLIVGVSVFAAPAFAMAQSAEQLIEKYTSLVGTAANATALVNGLRNGTAVKMSAPSAPTSSVCMPAIQPPPVGNTMVVPVMGAPIPVPLPSWTVEFSPPTNKMGYGNVDNALTLAQGTLKGLKIVTGEPQFGERKVTPEDVCLVLVGGDVTPPAGPPKITVPGILELRHRGHGWGEIAQQLELKL